MTHAKIDRVAPAFELPATTGGTIASWEFKARRPLVLFFPHAHSAACHDFLQRLAVELPRYDEYQAQLLALVPAALDLCQQLAAELSLPFPLLADAASVVRRRQRPGRQNPAPQPQSGDASRLDLKRPVSSPTCQTVSSTVPSTHFTTATGRSVTLAFSGGPPQIA